MKRIFLGTLLVALALPAPARADGPAPVLQLKADDTFFDDLLALDGAGAQLAVVRTDGSHKCRLEVLALPGGTKKQSVDLAPLSTTPERLVFSPDGTRVLVVAPHSASPPSRVAQVVDVATGKAGKRLGPATDFALATVGGKTRVVAFDTRTSDEGGTSWQVVVTDLESGKTVAKKALKAAAGGVLAVRGPELKPITWLEGYTQIVVTQQGEYDKKSDAQKPDSGAVFDVLKGKVIGTHDLKDLVAWIKNGPERAARPNQPAFVLPSDDLARLELLRRDDVRVALPLARPQAHYDLDSLRQKLDPPVGAPKQLWFSLLVDPTSRDAVAQKTYFADDLDLYVVDLAAAAPVARRVLSLSGEKREKRGVIFAVGGGRAALLRKHKTLERGGDDLRVFDVR